jgi:lysophospholipase L1-like esterase
VRVNGGRRALAAVAFVLCVASCGGSSTVSPPSPGNLGLIAPSYSGAGTTVVILGDSLVKLEWNDLYRGLDHQFAVKIGAFDGEGYNPGRFSAGLHSSVSVLVSAARTYAKSHPAVAVIALGTNDARFHRSTSNARAEMARVVAGFRGACLVGVTLPEHSTVKGWSNDEARSLNLAMRGWADQVVDWASMSVAPGVLTADGIHTTAKGTDRRAAAIIAAVRRCAAEHD